VYFNLKTHFSYLKTEILPGNQLFFFALFFCMKMDTLCPLAEYYCVLYLEPEADMEAECQTTQCNGIWSFSSLSDPFKSFGRSLSFFIDLHEINKFMVLIQCPLELPLLQQSGGRCLQNTLSSRA